MTGLREKSNQRNNQNTVQKVKLKCYFENISTWKTYFILSKHAYIFLFFSHSVLLTMLNRTATLFCLLSFTYIYYQNVSFKHTTVM